MLVPQAGPRPSATSSSGPRRPRSSARLPGGDADRGRHRREHPARHADPPSGGHGVAGRGPRGQAQGPRPVPRSRSAEVAPGLGCSRATPVPSWATGSPWAAPPPSRSLDASPACPGSSSTAQEDIRREIARAMHDGPAQSLTNIVLQAQIVERLVAKDPEARARRGPPARRDGPADARRDEDVHLRSPADGPRRPRPRADAPARSTRARPTGGRRRRVRLDGHGPPAVGGARERPLPDPRRGDRRLPRRPPRTAITLRLDWTDERVEGRVSATRDRPAPSRKRSERPPTGLRAAGRDKDLPPALAAMMEDRRRAGRGGRGGRPDRGDRGPAIELHGGRSSSAPRPSASPRNWSGAAASSGSASTCRRPSPPDEPSLNRARCADGRATWPGCRRIRLDPRPVGRSSRSSSWCSSAERCRLFSR